MERVAGKLDQDAAGNEILRISGGKSVAGRPFWRRGAWLATVWVLGQRRRGHEMFHDDMIMYVIINDQQSFMATINISSA